MSSIRCSLVAALFVSFLFLGVSPSSAQNGIDLDSLAPITSENVEQLEEIASFETASDWVAFAISPDGSKIAVIDSGGLRLFDTSTGEMGEYLITQPVSIPAFSGDGRVITAVTSDLFNNKIFIILLDDGAEPEVTSLDAAGIVGAGAALNADGTVLAYSLSQVESVSDATWSGYHIGPSTIHLVELPSMNELETFEDEYAIIGRMFFSIDGTLLNYSSIEWLGPLSPNVTDASLQVLNLETGEKSTHTEINNLLMDMSADGSLAYFSPLNALAGMVACQSPSALVNLESFESQFTLASDDECKYWQVGISPDSTLAAATKNAAAVVAFHDIETGTELTQLSFDNAETVYHPLFSQDGKLLVIGSTVNGQAVITVYGVPAT